MFESMEKKWSKFKTLYSLHDNLMWDQMSIWLFVRAVAHPAPFNLTTLLHRESVGFNNEKSVNKFISSE